MAKMTDSELSALLDAEMTSALGYLNGDLSADRETAMDYYLGKPFGNEVEGRSQVVSSDVADTIEWMVPALMKIFTAGDDVVTFEPQGKEDEEAAKQATEYNNFIFMRQNKGFFVLQTMFKDALLQRTGTAKVYAEFDEKEELDEFVNVPDDQYGVMAFEKEQENTKTQDDYAARKWQLENSKLWYLKEHSEEQINQAELGPITVHTGVWCRTVKKMKICVEAVPPEEMLVSRDAKLDLDEPAYMAHRTQKTASQLIEDGYPRAKVEGLPPDGPDMHTSGEKRARNEELGDDAFKQESSSLNKAMRRIWVTEAYLRVDYDGDGVAEMRRIVHAGKGTIILENEEWEGPRPFAIITPILIPHRLIGRSIADQTMEFQLLNSTLWRSTLDNLYLTNNPQKYVDPNAVNIDDLLQPRVGGIIRPPADGTFRPDGIVPVVVENFAAASYPMIEMVNQMRENRTGVTKYNQGNDADSLNKTARGISQIMGASQQRQDLVARNFAEGIIRIFGLINWNIKRYPDLAKRAIRLRNKAWVDMDPGTWPEDFDLVTNVGLGTNNKDQMLGHIGAIAAMQEKFVMLQQGTDGPFVTPKNLHATAVKFVENSGFKNADEFFSDPVPKPGEPPKPPKPQPPNPEVIKAQSDAQHQQAEDQAKMMKTQADGEAAKIKALADHEQKMKDMENEYQLKRDLAMRQAAFEERIAMLEHNLKEKMADHEMGMMSMKSEREAEMKEEMAEHGMAMKEKAMAKNKPSGDGARA